MITKAKKPSAVSHQPRERPILFSGEMVRALRDGRKTQTRRVVKPQPQTEGSSDRLWWTGDWDTRGGPRAGICTHGEAGNGEPTWTLDEIREHCPYGQPGDRLWVRESRWMWCRRKRNGFTKTGRQTWRYEPVEGYPPVYVADRAEKPVPGEALRKQTSRCWRYKHVRFMPRRATRLTLEIVRVRVERVQDITEANALAEGVNGYLAVDGYGVGQAAISARSVYESLWNTLNAARGFGWDANPWVWVIEFRKATPSPRPSPPVGEREKP